MLREVKGGLILQHNYKVTLRQNWERLFYSAEHLETAVYDFTSIPKTSNEIEHKACK